MRVLVTGGAGYIGSHTAKLLAQCGHTVVTYDNLSTGHRWAVRWGPLVVGDLDDCKLLRDTLILHNIDAVIHLAASAYVGESIENPRKYFWNNVPNALHVLDAMHAAGVKNIVFSSTCATYGMPQTLPIPESHPQEPINPYGESKLFVERVLHWYGEAYGVNWVTLRYFNAAGADSDGEIGEVHEPETHILPIAMDVALGKKGVVNVYGGDYPTPDGTAIRDYTHVLDLGRAHMMALEHLASGGESIALNLGTGKGHSVLAVIRAVEKASGRPVPIRLADRRTGDPPELLADPSLAQRVLGWQPFYSDLDSIVHSAWKWHANRNGYWEAVAPGAGRVGVGGHAAESRVPKFRLTS